MSYSNILTLNIISPPDICKKIAENFKARRLELDLTQEGISVKAGVKLDTFRRFERTGQISLINLTKLAFALNCTDEFLLLFTNKQYSSIEDVLNESKSPRQRGKRK